jgi:hypothetical protein
MHFERLQLHIGTVLQCLQLKSSMVYSCKDPELVGNQTHEFLDYGSCLFSSFRSSQIDTPTP